MNKEKMTVGVITEVGKLEFKEFDVPELLPYEVLYEVKSVALCTVEQRAFSGARNFGFPFVGGHENSGVVAAVGEGVTEYKVGDKIAATFNYCGTCEFCKRGLGTQCLNSRKSRKRFDFEGSIVGGALSPYLAVPQQQIVKLADDANFDHSALVEPLACCIHSIEKANIRFGETVVVIGSGIMGHLHMKLARMQGAQVIVSEVDPVRREKALNEGANYGIDPSTENAVERVKELTNGLGADVVINTIANPAVWGDAQAMLAPYGRLIAYSSQDSKEPIGISFGDLHSRETEYIGTVSPTAESNMRAAKLINMGLIDMEEVIDSRYDFKDAQKAFERAIIPNTYRVVIKHSE